MGTIARAPDGSEFIECVSDFDTSAVPVGRSPPLLKLLHEFAEQSVSYCYWKSSRRLHAVMRGRGDLDLLVAGSDRQRAETILLQQGFKRFPAVACRDHPSIESFLGYDEDCGTLLHVHLHLRLIVGEPLLKSYRIPWERQLLGRAARHPQLSVKMLDPASEAVLLVVRHCLELSRLDPLSLRDWRARTRKFARDRRALAARVPRAAVYGRAAEVFGAPLAEAVTRAVFSEQPMTRDRVLRRRLMRHFRADRTYSALEVRLRSAGRAVAWLAGNINARFVHLMRPWRRRAPGGGHLIAIVGLDGSGKSTAVAAMRSWLGSQIDVVPIYFGTGEGRPSLFLRPFKLVVPLITPFIGTKPKGASHGNVSERGPGLVYSLLLLVWAAAVALDKQTKLIAARRGADRGLIVIADRYPQNETPEFNDGPVLARAASLPAWIRRLEAHSYALARRLPPDLVVKLIVTAETAAAREPDMRPEIVRGRIAALERLQFPGARVVCVDAERPLAEVIHALRGEVWRLL